MTAIVAIEHKGMVHMASDSAITDENGEQFLLRSGKVFQRGRYVFGYTGAARYGAVLQHIVDWPEVPRYAIDKFANVEVSAALQKAFKEQGVEYDQSEALVGIAGRLYYLESDLALTRILTPYAAVGAGFGPAMGALGATARDVPDIRKRLVVALEQAEACSGTVRRPWRFARAS